MSELQTGIPLLSLPAACDIVGLAPHGSSENVVVTAQGTGVQVINVPDQRCVASLAVPSSRQFVCPAVFHAESQIYFAVLDNPSELCVWTDETDAFQNALFYSLDWAESAVHSLHTAKLVGSLLLVLENGAVAALHLDSLDSQKPHSLVKPGSGRSSQRSAEHVLWAYVLHDQPRQTTRLLTITKSKTQMQVALFNVGKEGDCKRVSVAPLVPPACDSSADLFLTSAAFQWPSNLITTWSTGVVCGSDVGRAGDRLASSQASVHCSVMFSLAAVAKSPVTGLSIKQHDVRVFAAVVNSTHLALAGPAVAANATHNLRGLPVPSAQLWDTHFHALRSTVTLGADETSAKRSSSSVQTGARTATVSGILPISPSCLVVALNNTVLALPVALQASSFASVLGAMAHTNTTPASRAKPSASSSSSSSSSSRHDVTAPDAQPKAHLYIPEWKSVADADTWAAEARGTSEQLGKLVQQLLDPKHSSSKSKLSKTFAAVLTACSPTIKESSSKKTAKKKLKNLPQALLVQIAVHCFNEERFFPEDILVQLLRTGRLTFRDCKVGLEALQEQERWEVAGVAMAWVVDLPESLVVQWCKHFLGQAEFSSSLSAILTADAQASETEAIPALIQPSSEHPAATFLRKSVCRKFDENNLVAALASLSLSEAQTFLAFLCGWLRILSSRQLEELEEQTEQKLVPTLQNLSDRIASILDAHFAGFLLSHESASVLARVQTVLAQHLQICASLKQVQAVLGPLEYSSIASAGSGVAGAFAAAVGPYSIEELEL